MIITLITDFGYKDPFVGIMKGVIAGINPHARIIDLSHGIAPQDIMGAALILRHSVNFFPPGSIHVVVVDPGVGSSRRPLLIDSGGNYLIGPDNGVLSLSLGKEQPPKIFQLSNSDFHRRPVSGTFHGRDIFAPVAAHLSAGVDCSAFGDAVDTLTRIDWPRIARTPSGIQGEIVYIDGFGNLFTNITEQDLKAFPDGGFVIGVADVVIHGLAANYVAGGAAGYAALINSWGLLEIAVNRGSAAQTSGATIGDKIQIRAQ